MGQKQGFFDENTEKYKNNNRYLWDLLSAMSKILLIFCENLVIN
jgi:hypothetical protein